MTTLFNVRVDRAQHYAVLQRLAKEANCPALRIRQYEHAVDKLNALIMALEIGRFIPKVRAA